MAQMTDEQREQKALVRARRAAEAAEEDDRRKEERRQQWQREGTCLSWAEIEAGEPCRGCGQPLLDGMGDWPPLLKLTPEQRAEYDRADAAFRERHGDCRAVRWSMGGHRAAHCFYCCPMPPLRDWQAEQLAQIFSSARASARADDLDAWELTLTCDHVVRRTQHRDKGDRCSTAVTSCPACARRRGVVAARRVGPADDKSGRVARERLAAELAEARMKLDKQRKAVKATERRIADLTRGQEEPGGAPRR
ncbi:MAG: hypothetical protein ACRDPY_22690 [Streptosporangiaceae bacterium]